MSMESFRKDANAMRERLIAEAEQVFQAYVAQEKRRAEVATQALKALARQHGVDPTKVRVENGLPPYNGAKRATFFFLGF